MSSPLRILRAGPPPPKVALLPDALFFTRSVPVTAGATGGEAAAQVELALEALAPFPLAQLYYGWFWTAGADHALVFAAYRRRVTSEQTAWWENADLVAPEFCAVLGAEVGPSTTIVLNAAESLTAVHWEMGPVPAKVLVRTLEPETTDDVRASAREELLRAIGGSKTIVDLQAPLAPDSANSDRELVFRSGDFVANVAASTAQSLDVRDKGELAGLRAARKRDVMLWRVMLGCAAALVLAMLGEFALVGGAVWQDGRIAKISRQNPTVKKIKDAQSLATRIEELATKRMLPFEMISAIVGTKEDNRIPPGIQFTRVTATPATGLNAIVIDGTSTPAAQLGVYLATLKNLPSVARVDDRGTSTRGDVATFTMVVTFKADALRAADTISQ
jgi:hypothetical protein